MRYGFLFLLLFFVACDDAPKPKPPPPAPKAIGYDAYVFACTSDGVDEGVCKCQAQILSRQLSDDKILILAEAGADASQGNTAKIDDIMANHPDILVAMEKLSLDAKLCAE